MRKRKEEESHASENYVESPNSAPVDTPAVSPLPPAGDGGVPDKANFGDLTKGSRSQARGTQQWPVYIVNRCGLVGPPAWEPSSSKWATGVTDSRY